MPYKLLDIEGEVARAASRAYRVLYGEPDAMQPRLAVLFYEEPLPQELAAELVDLVALTEDTAEDPWAHRSLRTRGQALYFHQRTGDVIYLDVHTGRWGREHAPSARFYSPPIKDEPLCGMPGWTTP